MGELSDPAQLWDTSYGRSILIKLALLAPIALIALYNRRIVAAVERISRDRRRAELKLRLARSGKPI